MKTPTPSSALGALLALLLSVCVSQARATVVQFETVLGDFQVLLYEDTTPQTAANFIEYVEAGAYTDTFIHRAISDFIVQGGGYSYDYQNEKLVEIPLHPPVTNEPVHSNVRGTIAMAKLPNQPHSAQAQWFFNLTDNAFLDDSNGGFTVFGEVLENGMDVVDAMAEVRQFTHTVDGFTLEDWPLRNYTRADRNAGVPVSEDQLVLIHSISVLYGVDEEEPPAQEDDEPTEPSAPETDEENQDSEEPEPVENADETEETPEDTEESQQPPPSSPPSSQPTSQGGGGSTNLLLILLLALAAGLTRRRRH